MSDSPTIADIVFNVDDHAAIFEALGKRAETVEGLAFLLMEEPSDELARDALAASVELLKLDHARVEILLSTLKKSAATPAKKGTR